MDVSIWELLIVLAIVVLLFGSRLPKVARSLGRAKTEFKEGLQEGEKGKENPA